MHPIRKAVIFRNQAPSFKSILALTLLTAVATAGWAQRPPADGSGSHHPWSLLDGADAHPEYRGQVPKKSDVVFSTRSKKPEAFEAANSFGATRVEWVYATDAEFVSQIKREVGWFGGALNSSTKLPSEAGMAKDFDDSFVAPWMKAWGVQLTTTTHPDTQKSLRAQAKAYLGMGADSIQCDDPALQFFSGTRLGGDFNPSTLAESKFLESYPDQAELKRLGLASFRGDYREFLKKSVASKTPRIMHGARPASRRLGLACKLPASDGRRPFHRVAA